MLKINIEKVLLIMCFLQLYQIVNCNSKIKYCQYQSKMINLKQIDSKVNLSIWDVLITKGVIPKEYPIEEIIQEQIVKDSDNKIIGFYKLNLHECLKDWEEDPVYNVLFMISNGDLILKSIVSSVYNDDFSLNVIREGKYYFLDYSSPAGIYRYYIVDCNNNNLYVTEKLSEDEFVGLDLLNFDFTNLRFVISSGKVKNITKLTR